MALFYKMAGKRLFYLLMDTAVVLLCYILSFTLLSYPDLAGIPGRLDLAAGGLLLVSFVLTFYFFRIYRIMWDYSNVRDVYRLLAANSAAFLFFSLVVVTAGREYDRFFAVAFLFIAMATVFYRVLLRDYLSRARSSADRGRQSILGARSFSRNRSVLIVGAGEAGRTVVAEFDKQGMGGNIRGFVDDDPAKIGKIFNGRTVYGPSGEIGEVISRFAAGEVIIAMPSVDRSEISRIAGLVKRVDPGITVKTLPSLTKIFEKTLSPELRDVGIADLIGREEFTVDLRAIEEKFSGKTILVTGAGGSIGSEICRQILKFHVGGLVAVGRGEHSIYNLIRDLGEYSGFLDYEPALVYRIADIKDQRLMERIFREYRPQVVFHAAAHKHVPLMEYNEIEAVQNNVLGTRNLLEISARYGVEEFVLISSDKAVRPVNVMGATKRLAELVTMHFGREKELRTAIVRFGNVLGSRGSVIPLFCEQIERGGPVTVTHPEIRRYFMSVMEASLLVLNAAAYAERGEVFVLDMGEQYRIADIARNLIRLYGFEPGRDIGIEYTGLRPGEKLYEELFYDRENLRTTQNDKIYMLNKEDAGISREALERFFREADSVVTLDAMGVRELIRGLVPEFEYSLQERMTSKTKFIS